MRNKPFSGLCLAFWICISANAFSQPDIIFFERFDESRGLPNNRYRQILQDRQGLLWMGGADGLARYDGYSFTEFRHNHADTNSLAGNNVSSMYEDSKGRLWIGTVGGGLNVSDENKSTFQRLKLSRQLSEDLSFLVREITEDKTGNIWLSSNKGIMILREKNGSYTIASDHDIFKEPGAGLLANPTFVYAGNNGQIWIGTATGLCMYDPGEAHFYTPEDFRGLPERSIQYITFDRNGTLWIACENDDTRLFYTSGSAFEFKPFNKIPILPGSKPIRLNFDLDNRLWVAVFGDEAFAYDFRDSSLFLQSKVNTNASLERFLRAPFTDHSGNVWLAAEGFYIYRYPKGFNHYHHPYAFHQSNTCIQSIHNILWFAYREQGLVRLDPATGKTDHYSVKALGDFHIPVNHIQKFLALKNGNKIIVGFGNIAVMNDHDKVIRNHSLSGTNRAILQDSKGRIWIGGYGGLHLFSEEKGVIRTYGFPTTDDRPELVQSIVEDTKGNIWFSSDIQGLGKLNPSTDTIEHFLPQKGNPMALPTVSIIDMTMDHQQILWLATDVGLVRFDPVTHDIKTYDTSAGIENDYICAVISDDKDRIWVSTHRGISHFDPAKEEFVNYGVRDGLFNTGYYTRNKFYSPDGLIYFGGKNGVDYFYPDDLRKNPTAPKMYLSGIKIDHQTLLTEKDIREAGEVKLVPANNIMEIEFIGLHFASQNAIRYQYQLEGLFNEWTDLGTEHKILLTHMKPGEYTFRAKAITPDQVESKEEIVIPIRVVPPFYSTMWFRIISTSALLGLLIGYIRYRENSIKREDKRESELHRRMNELEKRALQAQMNPHFIYNSMNAIQQFIIVHDVEGAMNYLSRFSRILRAVLNMSAENRIPLFEEIKLIEDYIELENMRFPDKFDYSITVSPELNIHTIEIPPFFIQPQVENAIRHGLLRKTTPGHLMVDIQKSGTTMRIIVEDNGIGRKAAAVAKSKETVLEESKGMAIVEERLKHFQPKNEFQPVKITDLYDVAGEAAGTRVEIILPIED